MAASMAAGTCDMKGGIASANRRRRSLHRHPSRFLRRDRDLAPRPTRNRAAMAASPTSPSRGISTRTACSTSSSQNRSTRTVSASAIAASGGPRSRPRARIGPMAPCRFWANCAVRHMGAVLAEMEASLFPLLAGKTHGNARVVPRRRAILRRSTSTRSTAGSRSRTPITPACRRLALAGPLSHHHRPPFPDRRGHRRGEGRRSPRSLEKVRAARPGFDYEIRDLFEVMPTMTDRDAPVVRTVQAAIERVLNRHAEFVVSPGTYDQKHIDRIGRLKELHRLRARHPRPCASTGRMGGYRRHGGQRQGHGG